MSLEYISGGKTFTLSYDELKNHYIEICELTDEEFIKRLPDALHLACIICFLKEIPTYICLTDKGIIHELIHLLQEDLTTTPIEDIRELFKQTLKLS